MVYPVAGKEGSELHDVGDNNMASGKYEPLVHMNTLLTEQVRQTMADTSSKCVCVCVHVCVCVCVCVCVLRLYISTCVH